MHQEAKKVNCDHCFVVVVWNWTYDILMLTPDKDSKQTNKKDCKTRIPHECKCKCFKQSAKRIQQYIKKPTSKGHILDGCIHITFSKWQCNREEKQTRVSRGKEWWRTESHNYKRVACVRYLQWYRFVFCDGDYTNL